LAASTITKALVVKVGTVAATTVKVTLDKATYTPGEKVVATLSLIDATGNPVAAGAGTGVLAAALTASYNTGGQTIFATAVPTKLGTATAEFYAPLLPGKFTISGTTGTGATALATAAQGVAITASATVTSSTEISSLTLLINSLIKKLNALSTLVAKIQKKLGVK